MWTSVISFMNLLLFPAPPSLFLTAMTVVSFVSLVQNGVGEVRGQNCGYSKFFFSSGGKEAAGKRVSSRVGMLLFYTPALVAAVAAAYFLADASDRCRLLSLIFSLHFFKRDFEVLFIHKYSGHIFVDITFIISMSYGMSVVCMTYSQYLTQGMQAPSLDLKNIGLVLASIGMIGNLYHHYILSTLRKEGEKGYKVPKGGLFGLVICPHYLFEITEYIGIFCISQTVYSFFYLIGTAVYLSGRSYATRRWYISKFDDFPRNVRALIPFVF
ncbi:3-oxo-5-alpha-steroid 4-dehydrogenase 2 isoform X1 [Canna indica]|uniref:3-oxo-5-alpha-steroid 4-dehydrogenase 2 isoform X1 n=1 Tax=Canna indica TaxID=4628 RepID=A0AAQ3QSC2_9LILI|nr:3-oxo-5-alpha-steroid 4-dehydrogenase 2 isoform X1 [Canna indica]